MKVTLVTPQFPPTIHGGGEISVKLLATELRTHSAIKEISVLTFGGQRTERIDGVEVRRLGSLPSPPELVNFVAYRRLRPALKAVDPDVIHAYNMEIHPAAGILSDRLDIPAVSTLNSYTYVPSERARYTDENALKRLRNVTTFRLLRRCLRSFDAHICLSDPLKRIYAASGLPLEDLVTIPNMIDPSFGVPDRKSDTATDDVLYVGALGPHKGVADLVKAVTHLSDRVHLRIAGDGSDRRDLEALSKRLGVDTQIEFLGSVPYEEIPALYAQADLFVHPGVWAEPFGRTILEAMQAGLPVACTDVGAPPTIVPDGNPICRAGNPADLAAKIESGIENGQAIRKTNRTYVSEQYAPQVVLPRIVDLYKAQLSDDRVADSIGE